MKALIWISCIGLFAAVEIVTALTGRELCVTPTILLARVLSLRYDEAQKRKRAEERRRAAEKK